MEKKITTELTATSIISKAQIENYLEWTANDDTEDALIADLVEGAIRLCEDHTGEAFGEKTVEVWVRSDDLDEDDRVDLPFPPFGEMTSVTPYDVENTAGDALVLNTGYYLNGLKKKSIKLLTEKFLVGSDLDQSYWKIIYTCGYDISEVTEAIPETYKYVIMELVRRWYKREEKQGVISEDLKADLDIICGNTVL